MKCPHCRVEIHDTPQHKHLGADGFGEWFATVVHCPACKKYVITVSAHGGKSWAQNAGYIPSGKARLSLPAYPKGFARLPAPKSVPREMAEDYGEACAVLNDSPKASAALSRRCLQHLLRTAAGVKHSDLANEIQEVLDSGKLPTHLAESIDAIRNVGNFAAHPLKSKASGEILPVEPHEAEWNLDVLEALFDFYFVQPEVVRQRRAALDVKLASAGKPPLK